MEAITFVYPHEQAGQISVTATKGEWQDVIERVLKTVPLSEDAGDRLVYWLINQGVYE